PGSTCAAAAASAGSALEPALGVCENADGPATRAAQAAASVATILSVLRITRPPRCFLRSMASVTELGDDQASRSAAQQPSAQLPAPARAAANWPALPRVYRALGRATKRDQRRLRGTPALAGLVRP